MVFYELVCELVEELYPEKYISDRKLSELLDINHSTIFEGKVKGLVPKPGTVKKIFDRIEQQGTDLVKLVLDFAARRGDINTFSLLVRIFPDRRNVLEMVADTMERTDGPHTPTENQNTSRDKYIFVQQILAVIQHDKDGTTGFIMAQHQIALLRHWVIAVTGEQHPRLVTYRAQSPDAHILGRVIGIARTLVARTAMAIE
jgi:hypothetical protein